MGELIRNLATAISLHLRLVDGQNRTIPSNRDDVSLHHFLRNMRTGQVNVFVIGIIPLIFLFDHWPLSHGRSQSQCANSHTQY